MILTLNFQAITPNKAPSKPPSATSKIGQEQAMFVPVLSPLSQKYFFAISCTLNVENLNELSSKWKTLMFVKTNLEFEKNG